MLRFAGSVLGIALLVAACGQTPDKGSGSAASVKAVEDIESMTVQRDGSYRVVCRDGRVEFRSASEIRSDRVCMNGGGGGGGSGILRCVARDNDGRNPWIIAQFNSNGDLTRFSELVFDTLENCQSSVSANVRVGFDVDVVCASRDRDGRNPWALGVISRGSASLARAVYGDFTSCRSALARARTSRDFMLTCTSRDADGRNPWSYVTVNSAGTVNLRTDTTFGSLDECLRDL